MYFNLQSVKTVIQIILEKNTRNYEAIILVLIVLIKYVIYCICIDYFLILSP